MPIVYFTFEMYPRDEGKPQGKLHFHISMSCIVRNINMKINNKSNCMHYAAAIFSSFSLQLFQPAPPALSFPHLFTIYSHSQGTVIFCVCQWIICTAWRKMREEESSENVFEQFSYKQFTSSYLYYYYLSYSSFSESKENRRQNWKYVCWSRHEECWRKWKDMAEE